MKTYSQTQRDYINAGETQFNILERMMKRALGLTNKKVEGKRHAIISGGAGVGKSYTALKLIKESGKNYITLGSGATDSTIIQKVAYACYNLPENEELILFIDDADGVIFKDKKTIDKWKIAMGGKDTDPVLVHDVAMLDYIEKLRNKGKPEIAEALDAYQKIGEPGISIPMDRVRIFILCNVDYGQFDNTKVVKSSIAADVEALIDRVRFERLDFEWKVAWGWLAYILQNAQPFEDDGIILDDEQKQEVARFMWDKWEIMRNTSFRTIEEMAEYMVEEPDDYLDDWERFLKVR